VQTTKSKIWFGACANNERLGKFGTCANNEKSWLRTGANNESLAHVQTTKNGLALWLIGLAHGQTIMQTTEKVVNRFGTWAINRLWHMCEQRKMGKIWFGACANKESCGNRTCAESRFRTCAKVWRFYQKIGFVLNGHLEELNLPT
jgi:hypothetical protein